MYSKELLNEEVRASLSVGDAERLISSINENLDDDDLTEKLRQVRNIFARGGSDLQFDQNELDVQTLVKMIEPLMENFVKTEWLDGLALLFQILFNSCDFYSRSGSILDLYFPGEKLRWVTKAKVFDMNSLFLEQLKKLELERSKVSPLLCAVLFQEFRANKPPSENAPEAISHCLRFCISSQGNLYRFLLERTAAAGLNICSEAKICR